MGRDEDCTDQRLKESTEEGSRETKRNLTDEIINLYNMLEELGYLPKDLYEMDLNELESTLLNRRKGIANECFMIGMLSRTALAKDLPKTPEEMYPYMFPQKKKYAMPDFLREKYLEQLKERGDRL